MLIRVQPALGFSVVKSRCRTTLNISPPPSAPHGMAVEKSITLSLLVCKTWAAAPSAPGGRTHNAVTSPCLGPGSQRSGLGWGGINIYNVSNPSYSHKHPSPHILAHKSNGLTIQILAASNRNLLLVLIV